MKVGDGLGGDVIDHGHILIHQSFKKNSQERKQNFVKRGERERERERERDLERMSSRSFL